jgi:hypothetical protein
MFVLQMPSECSNCRTHPTLHTGMGARNVTISTPKDSRNLQLPLRNLIYLLSLLVVYRSECSVQRRWWIGLPSKDLGSLGGAGCGLHQSRSYRCTSVAPMRSDNDPRPTGQATQVVCRAEPGGNSWCIRPARSDRRPRLSWPDTTWPGRPEGRSGGLERTQRISLLTARAGVSPEFAPAVPELRVRRPDARRCVDEYVAEYRTISLPFSLFYGNAPLLPSRPHARWWWCCPSRYHPVTPTREAAAIASPTGAARLSTRLAAPEVPSDDDPPPESPPPDDEPPESPPLDVPLPAVPPPPPPVDPPPPPVDPLPPPLDVPSQASSHVSKAVMLALAKE